MNKFMIPNTTEDLIKCLEDSSEHLRILGGCTDVMIQTTRDSTDYDYLDLTHIEELKGIEETDDMICIGAITTLSEIVNSDIINKQFPMLSNASFQVGSTQIRNVATIGGNLGNAFAGADLIPPLISLDAQIKTIGPMGMRTLPINELIVGNRKTSLMKNEVIIGVELKKVRGFQYFEKIGTRTRVTISKLNMAALIETKENIIISSRLTFGALGTTAFRAYEIEEYLKGKDITSIDDGIHEMFEGLVDAAIPTRNSRLYKRKAIRSISDNLISKLGGRL